jgi:GTPase SAR1 family protein
MGAFLSGLMESLGFVNKTASIVVLGLDNAGKTTFIHRLMTGKITMFAPTQRAVSVRSARRISRGIGEGKSDLTVPTTGRHTRSTLHVAP